MRYRPSGRAVVIALWRANIKPPLEVVVDNLEDKGYLHPVLSGRGTLPASWFRQFAGYETAGQPAGRQETGRQGQHGTQGLYPWDGYVFHGGKAASWESSPF